MAEKNIHQYRLTVVKGAEYESVTCEDKDGCCVFGGSIPDFVSFLADL